MPGFASIDASLLGHVQENLRIVQAGTANDRTGALLDENMALLKDIRERQPASIDALATAVGKHVPNVSRSLHTMAQYGLVKLTKHGRTVMPQVTSERVTVDFSWGN